MYMYVLDLSSLSAQNIQVFIVISVCVYQTQIIQMSYCIFIETCTKLICHDCKYRPLVHTYTIKILHCKFRHRVCNKFRTTN